MDEPRTREEQYLSKIAGEDILIPAPVTRQEKYLAKMAGEDVDVPKAVTRVEHYYEGVIKVIEESVKPEPLTVTENGTYAESGKAYNPVTVNVPTYGAADVGKVVTESSGEYALTPQTSQSITANGTYDTTLNNEVTVNVSGGGGGRDWSEIGYSAEPPTIEEGFEYAKQIAQSWGASTVLKDDRYMRFMPFVNTTGRANFGNMFYNCSSLIYLPQLDTSSGTDFRNMFRSCSALQSLPTLDLSEATNMSWFAGSAQSLRSLPQFNTSKVTDMNSMCYYCTSLKDVPVLNTAVCTDMTNSFKECGNLTDASLNNILLMCANSAVTSSKTLTNIGLTSAQKTKCQTLSNWSAFVAAGWSA